jgi:hypothetical protein
MYLSQHPLVAPLTILGYFSKQSHSTFNDTGLQRAARTFFRGGSESGMKKEEEAKILADKLKESDLC